jgi:hypothetical protein
MKESKMGEREEWERFGHNNFTVYTENRYEMREG